VREPDITNPVLARVDLNVSEYKVPRHNLLVNVRRNSIALPLAPAMREDVFKVHVRSLDVHRRHDTDEA